MDVSRRARVVLMSPKKPDAVSRANARFLAERLGAEIVSTDSMQVYRGLDIGTAKPNPAERARVPLFPDLIE